MKNLLLFAIGLISAFSLSTAQTINDYIQSIEMIDMGETNLETFCFFDGAIYYLTFDEEDENKNRYTIVKKTPTSTESMEFEIWQLMKSWSCYKIFVDSNFVILEDQFITYYLLRTPEGLKNILSSTHKESAEQIKIYGNSIYRSHSSIQGDALWEKTQTWVEVFDLEKKTHRIFDFPNPLGIELMYFQPRKLIEFTKENVFVMDALEYKIKIYNYDGKLVDSIYKPFKDNKITPIPINDHSKEELYRFDVVRQRVLKHREVLLKNLYNAKVMSKIDLLNDTTLLICYNVPTEDNKWYWYAYDVWKFNKITKKWVVFKEDLKIEPNNLQNREGNFDIKRLYIKNHYSAYFNNTLVTQNKYSYDILKLKTYTTWKEFHSLSEDYLKKSEIPNTIFIYRLQF